jgi:hypothetical protein
LEDFHIADVRRQPRHRLAARAADAGEEDVAARHLQHARDAADVLDREEEENELHRLGRDSVVVLKVTFRRLLQRRDAAAPLAGASIRLLLRLRVGERVVHQRAHVVVVDLAPDALHRHPARREERGELDVEVGGAQLLDLLEEPGDDGGQIWVLKEEDRAGDGAGGAHHLLEEPRLVVRIDQPIVEDAKHLVSPQQHQLLRLLEVVLRAQAHPLHHTREVAQVEGVVGLRRRRQQVGERALVRAHRRADDRCREALVLGLEALFDEEPVQDRLEDELHRRLVERRERDDVEVAHVPRRDRVAPAARRAHRADEREVDEAAERVLFAVVPARVIHPLAQQLDRRLRAVHLELRHVQIVDEDDGALPHRRAVHALPPLVELGVDDVLRLVGL